MMHCATRYSHSCTNRPSLVHLHSEMSNACRALKTLGTLHGSLNLHSLYPPTQQSKMVITTGLK